MDILHIFKTKPTIETELYIKKLSEDKNATTINLFASDTDWDDVLDKIFSHKKVVTWW